MNLLRIRGHFRKCLWKQLLKKRTNVMLRLPITLQLIRLKDARHRGEEEPYLTGNISIVASCFLQRNYGRETECRDTDRHAVIGQEVTQKHKPCRESPLRLILYDCSVRQLQPWSSGWIINRTKVHDLPAWCIFLLVMGGVNTGQFLLRGLPQLTRIWRRLQTTQMWFRSLRCHMWKHRNRLLTACFLYFFSYVLLFSVLS